MHESQGSFEQTLQALEHAAARLESGRLTLDESLAEFEKGIALHKHCMGILNQAERQIEHIERAEQANQAGQARQAKQAGLPGISGAPGPEAPPQTGSARMAEEGLPF